MHTGVSADDGSSECISDSDMNIRPDRKPSVIGSDTGSGSETLSARECSFASAEE